VGVEALCAVPIQLLAQLADRAFLLLRCQSSGARNAG
jgi:hypothetical protein